MKSKRDKILLFDNIFNSCKEANTQRLGLSTLYLASGLRKAGFRVIIVPLKKDGLKQVLKENLDINFIGISVYEGLFDKTRDLIRFLRRRTKAFIGVGGIMPTLTPNHILVHLPEINFLIRGYGEKIFPQLVNILSGRNINSPLTEKVKKELQTLKGLLFKKEKLLIRSESEYINPLKDSSDLVDFSLLKKEDLNDGLFLFTSSGCFNNCLFCTSPSKGKFLGISFENLKKIFEKYYAYLKKIFGGHIPLSALRIAFLDDDFLGDSERAIKIFNYFKKSPFKINFFQTGINSFYTRKNSQYTNILNKKLINSLSPELFDDSKEVNIYIGLENLSDEELKRLNKGYNSSKAKRVIKILAKKRIKAAYHFIASNQLTSLKDILENLSQFSSLQNYYGSYFKILTPIIPYLVSLFPSISYKIIVSKKRKRYLNIRKTLKIKNHPEYDYPLVENDIPINKNVRDLVPVLQDLFSKEKNYSKILDKTLCYLLNKRYKKNGLKERKEIDQLIEEYNKRLEIKNDRHNIQLMITRRCHLRCKYCPIVKKNVDMSEKVLYQAIDFLFTSPNPELRLDFTGGEPLLRFDLIRKGVYYAEKKAKETNKKISFYLVSNLIALNEQIADFLKEKNFFLEISLDGQERFHNTYKIGLGSKINPYQLTVRSVKETLSRKINCCGVMVVSPSNVNYLFLNFCHLLKLGIRRICINYALGQYWTKEKIRQFLKQLNLIRQRFFVLINKKIIHLNNIENRIEPAVLSNEIMIDVDGEVYLLTDWLFEKKARNKISPMGKIKDFPSINDIPITKSNTLYRMIKIYPQKGIRKIIFNNIQIGNIINEYFKKWQ